MRPAGDELFAGYADGLLDSTFKYYKVPERCLFNENYPKQENEMVTYLAGSDAMRKDKAAYLWPTSGLYSAVNALLKATGEKKYDTLLQNIILPGLEQYYDTIRKPACYQSYLSEAGYSDRFYDDNVWLGLDFLESYQLTGRKDYLNSSANIWKFLESGCDSVLGGGIYWCEQKKFSKNTCSNAPASVLALKLYQATGDEAYLQAGKNLYHWIQDNLQDTADCLYFDNKKLDGRVGKTKYQYNSGQMLQAAALLYKLTGEEQYLADAQNLTKSCSDYFFEDYTAPDGTAFRALKNGNIWFVAIMLRGFEELYGIDQNSQYLNDFKSTLSYIRVSNRQADGLSPDEQFVKEPRKKEHKWLLTQAALIEMYARLSTLKQ
ncbi:MAG: glycoside hydrolase family 76 protein [Bacteroides sp.]|nr:glycoside hydrolase family 76 protein [Bacteroides sp.]